MAQPEPATGRQATKETEVGSVFVSNYPPYSAWNTDDLVALRNQLQATPQQDSDLGLYVHVPFCRKRCKFCYFKVYIGRNSSEVQHYLDDLLREARIYAETPVFRGRPLKFVYFGGGTPSYLSTRQLRGLVGSLREIFDWSQVQEFSFECEPGTLTEAKVKTLADLGVTRLSLGVENFDDDILSENGRAHVTTEIERVIPWVKAAGFRQFNLDLISGMVGETTQKWTRTVERTIEVAPDSVTIYQMELPFNTVYSSKLRDGETGEHFADWDTKRRWHKFAIGALGAAGYVKSSAYTMVREDREQRFVYRDALWHGADMMGTGVASFSHVQGIHYQNVSSWTAYLESIDRGELPLQRAYETTKDKRFIRQFILQLKLGTLDPGHFIDKFGIDPRERFETELETLRRDGYMTDDTSRIDLTMDGLLRVDTLLPRFYEPEFRGARYT